MRVYAIHGAPPEVQAYALAKYSRSAQTMQASIDELSTQRAEQFLSTFYFQYGHRSIADLAHVTLAIEDISILAAFQVTDEPLWDGQSRSSRYQDFRKNGFYIPPLLIGTTNEQKYLDALNHLLTVYESVSAGLVDVLKQVQPCPSDMTPATYTRTLKARALDVARYLLPLATRTSIGQVTSARVIEQQISRLTGNSLEELQAVGSAMRTACQDIAENFVANKLTEYWASSNLPMEEIAKQREALVTAGVLDVHAAPTLVKYTNPDSYSPAVFARVRPLLQPFLDHLPAAPSQESSVMLHGPEGDIARATVLSLAYLITPVGHSYAQLAEMVEQIPQQVCEEIFTATFTDRGPHDDLLRLHRTGYQFLFDILVDFGSMRDLHRHRRCVQLVPELKTSLGYERAADVFQAGLGEAGAAAALAQGITEHYDTALATALETAQTFPQQEYMPYLLPLGIRQRALFKMDFAEAAYIIDQRTTVTGHFSYRRIAYAMYTEIVKRYPYLAATLRVTNPYAVIDLLKR